MENCTISNYQIDKILSDNKKTEKKSNSFAVCSRSSFEETTPLDRYD